MVTNGLKHSNFKEWLWSAKVLTPIVWIIFPLGYITIVFILSILTFGGESTFYMESLFKPLVFKIPFEVHEFLNIPRASIIIPPLPFMIILSLFSLLPAIYPTEKFFEKRGNENAVLEYRQIRKILFAFLITLIVTIIILYSLYPFLNKLVRPLSEQGMSRYEIFFHSEYSSLAILTIFLYYYVFVLAAVPIFILLKLLLEHARKQFRFYYAKACFEMINESKNETDKNGYLLLGLDWYNKFVKRITKGGIDIQTIYSKIVSHAPLSDNILLDTIMESFHGDDELKPMRHMLDLLSCWKEGATLVKESLRTRVKESSDLLIPIVTVAITIITTFFLKAPSQ